MSVSEPFQVDLEPQQVCLFILETMAGGGAVHSSLEVQAINIFFRVVLLFIARFQVINVVFLYDVLKISIS